MSISVGAKPIPLHRVWELLFHDDGSQDGIVVHDLRIPRTMLGLLVGAALGVAGALMQALTRNPLADPGLLGINAGAATAIVLGVALLGITRADRLRVVRLRGRGAGVDRRLRDRRPGPQRRHAGAAGAGRAPR